MNLCMNNFPIRLITSKIITRSIAPLIVQSCALRHLIQFKPLKNPINNSQVERCCWSTYSAHRDTKATLAILDNLDNDGEMLNDEEIARLFNYEQLSSLTKWQNIRPKIWQAFVEPCSSIIGKCIACISVVFICLSVLSFCLKTTQMPFEDKVTRQSSMNSTGRILYYVEHTCNAWFATEIILLCVVSYSLYKPYELCLTH